MSGSPAGRLTRTGVALFDAAVMSAAALQVTGGASLPVANVVLWGSAAAAAVVAVVIATGGPALLAWLAIGYVLHAALLVTRDPNVIVLALAVALTPVAPRLRGSLSAGIAVATLSAFAARALLALSPA